MFTDIQLFLYCLPFIKVKRHKILFLPNKENQRANKANYGYKKGKPNAQ